MYEIINPLAVSWPVWFGTLGIAFFAGVSKSGLKGLIMIGIPILAGLYGAKQSTGILLPFLIFGDILAIRLYFKHANYRHMVKMLPYAVVGILLAVYTGKYINDKQFTHVMATVVLVGLALIVVNDLSKSNESILKHKAISPIFGMGGGFATMIGNMAGPIFSLYLLTLRLPKKEFIGTGAMFYLTLNLFKLPFHFVSWGTMTWQSLWMNVVMLPVLLLGFVAGSRIVRYIPEKLYRHLILLVTSISAIMLYWK
ncbi:MAG: sulfite exporter TauE/SafE family protein [Breznakibacter sp.]